MPLVEPITIRGLRDLQAALKQMDGQTQKKLRLALNESAELIVEHARPKVPKGASGKARASLKAVSQQRVAIVRGGGSKAPYYPWLDFGGNVGRKKSVKRQFIDVGRYIYPSFSKRYDDILATLEASIVSLAKEAGLDVT